MARASKAFSAATLREIERLKNPASIPGGSQLKALGDAVCGGSGTVTTIGQQVTFSLPFPPSTNHLYMRNAQNKGQHLKPAVVAFRGAVLAYLMEHHWPIPRMDGWLEMSGVFFVPDRRKRDLGNLIKSVEDALQEAHVFDDDYYISDYGKMSRKPFNPDIPAHAVVTLRQIALPLTVTP
jgi:crossover junction endodeoxyribonuclease RusA